MRLTPKTKDKIEIEARKKQEKEKFKFSHALNIKPNQRCFELDLVKLTVRESEYIIQDDTIKYTDVINNTLSLSDRNVVINTNCDYVIKLNIKNALKHFKKVWNNDNIIIDEKHGETANKLFKKQNKVKLFKNK